MDQLSQYRQFTPGSGLFKGQSHSSLLFRIGLVRLVCFIVFFVTAGCDDIFEKDISDSVIESISPKAGWSTTDHEVKFSWSPMEGATEYHFELGSPSFNDLQQLVCDSVLTKTTLTLDIPEGSYQWRIRGQNFGYFSLYSKADFQVIPEFDLSKQSITLIQPTNSEVLKQSPVSLKWSAVEGVHYYQIKIMKDSWSGESVVSEKVFKPEFRFDLEDGNYAWGVAATDTIRKKSTDYSMGSFTVDKNAPASPLPVLPAKNDTSSALLVQFSWTKPEEGLTYDLELFSDAILTSLVISKQTTDTAVVLTLSQEGPYYWRVRATDKNNNTGAFSAASSFLVKLVTDIHQRIVTLRSPDSSVPLTGTSVTFWWDELPGAEKYQLQVVSPGFSQTTGLLVNEWLTGTTKVAELSPGIYQWRVKASNSQYSTGYSTGSFTIYKSDISSQLVVLTTPGDQSLLNHSPVSFQWQKIDGCDYQFVLKKGAWDSGTEVQRKKLSGTTLDLSLADGDYTWGVKAIDQTDQSETEFARYSFTVDKTPPSVPVLTSPVNNSSVTTGENILKWQSPDSGSDGVTYTIHLYRQTGDQNTLILDQTLTSTEYTYYFTEAGTYLWQVKATDKAGNASTFSTMNKFVTAAGSSLANQVVTLKAPYNGYSSTNSEVTFWWDMPEDAELSVFQLVKPGFTNIEQLIREVSLTTNQITVQLEPGTYQWRVKAKNSTSETPFSGAFTLVRLADEE